MLFHFSQSYSVVHDKNQVVLTRKSKGSIDQLLSLGSIDDLSYKHFTKVSVLDQSCVTSNNWQSIPFTFLPYIYFLQLLLTQVFSTLLVRMGIWEDVMTLSLPHRAVFFCRTKTFWIAGGHSWCKMVMIMIRKCVLVIWTCLFQMMNLVFIILIPRQSKIISDFIWWKLEMRPNNI